MKVSVSQQQLAHGLGVVSRQSIPAAPAGFGKYPDATDEGRLRLSATNLELGLHAGSPPRLPRKARLPCRLALYRPDQHFPQ
jgi:DNA polymerase-3 subunit beta